MPTKGSTPGKTRRGNQVLLEQQQQRPVLLMDSKKGRICSKQLPNGGVLFWGKGSKGRAHIGESKQSKLAGSYFCLLA